MALDKHQAIKDVIAALRIVAPGLDLTEESELVGRNQVIDSIQLVQMSVILQDGLESKGYSFDWSSENAMSSQLSIFRTVSSLADYISSQNTEA